MGGFRNPWLGFKIRKSLLYSNKDFIMNADSMVTGIVIYLIDIPFTNSIW